MTERVGQGRREAGPGTPTAERGQPELPQGLRRTLAVFRCRDYVLFWVGMTVSMVGTWMQVLAQSWVVVEQLRVSASALGWINFAGAFPMFLFSLFGGVAADRYDKRRILLVTQVAMMALAFLFAALVGSGHVRLWHVLLISVLGGVAAAYDMPAFQAYYPTLVAREDMPQAIALNQASFHGSRVVGPALAGVAVGAWGATSAFVANGISFLAVIAALLLIRARPAVGGAGRSATKAAMAEGLRYVTRDIRLQSLMALTALSSLLIFPNVVGLMPIYVKEILRVGPDGLGLLMSAGGFGALLGAVTLLLVPRAARLPRIILAVCAIAIGLTILGHSRLLWLSVVGVAVVSLGMATSWGLSATIIQESVPDALRGRVMSVHGMTFVGIMPFAAVLISSAADLLGLAREQQLAAILYALVSVWLLRRLVRVVKKSEPIGNACV